MTLTRCGVLGLDNLAVNGAPHADGASMGHGKPRKGLEGRPELVCGLVELEALNFFAQGAMKLKTQVRILSKREEWQEEMFGQGPEGH